MKYHYKCLWCLTPFIATRVDQKFHTTKCRNASSSYDYRQRNLIYKELSDATKQVDEILHPYYSITKQVLIRESDFKKLRIDISASIRMVVNDKNEVIKLQYGHYSLIHEQNRIFKLIKNKKNGNTIN